MRLAQDILLLANSDEELNYILEKLSKEGSHVSKKENKYGITVDNWTLEEVNECRFFCTLLSPENEMNEESTSESLEAGRELENIPSFSRRCIKA